MGVDSDLAQIAAVADQKERVARYKALIEKLAAAAAIDDICACFERVLSPDEAQATARNVTAFAAEKLSGLGAAHPEAFLSAAQRCLDGITGNAVSYDDAEHVLRHGLFDHLVADGQYKEAAAALAGLDLEGGGRDYPEEEKAAIYVKVAEAYLEDDEPDLADNFVSKASGAMAAVTDVALQLRYRTTAARVLDANRKYLDAAVRFYELSQTQQGGVVAEDLLELLGRAITCAVLGKAGPQRSRVLGTLYKDSRLRQLEELPAYSTHAQVLAKMYKEQILRKHELEMFEAGLADHHKALTGEGLTIPQKAVIEHNMVAAGRIYDNIRFVELGALLELPSSAAEKTASRMIAEGRLHGSIDQVAGMLRFAGSGDEMLLWDERIGALCLRINVAYDAIASSHLQLLEPAAS